MDSIDLAELAEQLRAAAHDPLDEFPVTVSIGVALHLDRPTQGAVISDPAERIANGMISADVAMYAAKTCGGNCVITRKIGGDSPVDRRIKLTLPARQSEV